MLSSWIVFGAIKVIPHPLPRPIRFHFVQLPSLLHRSQHCLHIEELHIVLGIVQACKEQFCEWSVLTRVVLRSLFCHFFKHVVPLRRIFRHLGIRTSVVLLLFFFWLFLAEKRG